MLGNGLDTRFTASLSSCFYIAKQSMLHLPMISNTVDTSFCYGRTSTLDVRYEDDSLDVPLIEKSGLFGSRLPLCS